MLDRRCIYRPVYRASLGSVPRCFHVLMIELTSRYYDCGNALRPKQGNNNSNIHSIYVREVLHRSVSEHICTQWAKENEAQIILCQVLLSCSSAFVCLIHSFRYYNNKCKLIIDKQQATIHIIWNIYITFAMYLTFEFTCKMIHSIRLLLLSWCNHHHREPHRQDVVLLFLEWW